MNNQNRKRAPMNRRPNLASASGSNNNSQFKKPTVIQKIDSINKFPAAKVNTINEFPIPKPFSEPKEPVFDLPSIKQHPASQLTSDAKLLATNFLATTKDLGRSLTNDPNCQNLSNDNNNPLFKIIIKNRSNIKHMKLGSHIVNIFAPLQTIVPENPIIKQNATTSKLLNRLVHEKDSLQTPAKRIREEVIDASSSMKKNRRTLELSGTADTTMELSFEGKAMDRNDIVKMIDTSAIIADDSQLPDFSMSQPIDTKNLLQSTNFQF